MDEDALVIKSYGRQLNYDTLYLYYCSLENVGDILCKHQVTFHMLCLFLSSRKKKIQDVTSRSRVDKNYSCSTSTFCAYLFNHNVIIDLPGQRV